MTEINKKIKTVAEGKFEQASSSASRAGRRVVGHCLDAQPVQQV